MQATREKAMVLDCGMSMNERETGRKEIEIEIEFT